MTNPLVREYGLATDLAESLLRAETASPPTSAGARR
jgi:hypothetical protein